MVVIAAVAGAVRDASFGRPACSEMSVVTHRPVPLDVGTWTDVSDWPTYAEENRGIREKRWVRSPDGTRWLRKRPRPGRPYEPAIEWFALNLARNVGIVAAEPVLCEWVQGHERIRGICVKRFVDSFDELISGTEVMRGADPAYDPRRREAHSPWRVREALERLEARNEADVIQPFVDLILFDAWIGNADRHPGNWSVLRRPTGGLALSPLYDPAASLGAELHDRDKLLRDPPARATKGQKAEREKWLRNYVEKCPSGFGDEVSLIAMPQLIDAIRTWPEWEPRSRLWLPAFATALVAWVPSLLRNIDEAWLPRKRKAFAEDMLRRRLRWLEERR